MKIRCLHGFFQFEETSPGEIGKFNSLYDFDLVADGEKFTFETLSAAPKHALLAGTYIDAPVLKTFAGEPWEIMRANELVYNFQLDEVVPILSVTNLADFKRAGTYFVSNGLILPGSLMDSGDRVKDYAAWFSFDTMKFKYSEVSFE